MPKKQLSSMTNGPYDINIIADYVRMEKLIDSKEIILKRINKENYLENFKTHLEEYCVENGYDFQDYFGNKAPILVDSKTYGYDQHLGHCLVSFDINKISALLDYQFAAYTGDLLFPSIVEHGVYNCVKTLSKFSNNARLKEIMRWVAAHRKFIPNPNQGDPTQVTTLVWVNGDHRKLKLLSRRIWKNKGSEMPLDFYRAIIEGTKTKWLVSPEILSHLIFTLVAKRLLKSKRTRGHFKAAQKLFDFGQKTNGKIRLSELSSSINKDISTKPAKRKIETDFVSRVIYSQ